MPGFFGPLFSEKTPEHEQFVKNGKAFIGKAKECLGKCKAVQLDVAAEDAVIRQFEKECREGAKQTTMPPLYPGLIVRLSSYVSDEMPDAIKNKLIAKIISQIDEIIDLHSTSLQFTPRHRASEILKVAEDLEAEQKALPEKNLSMEYLLEYSKAFHATIDSLQHKELTHKVKSCAYEAIELAKTLAVEDNNPIRKVRHSAYHQNLLTRLANFSDLTAKHNMKSLQDELTFWSQTQQFLQQTKAVQDKADLADSQKTTHVPRSMTLN